MTGVMFIDECEKKGDSSKTIGLSYLILLLTRRCNLSCEYCYNGEAKALDMSEKIMDEAFKLLSRSTGPFHIQLTGGEATLVPELVKKAYEKTTMLIKETGRPGTLAIQTNGTLLNAEMVKNLKNWRIEVGISLDASPDINDKIRGKTKNLLEGLSLLNDHNIPFNVTTVLSSLNVSYLHELPLFLARYPMVRGIGLDLLTRKGRGFNVFSPERNKLYESVKKLCQTLELVNLRRISPLILRELELVKNACVRGNRPHFCEAHKGGSIAVDPLGELFPCGQAFGDESLSMGTVFEPKFPKADFRDYNLFGDHCKGCPLEGHCPGECPGRLYFNTEESLPLVCEIYRSLYDNIKDTFTADVK
jgi:uncharacterized protein